MAAELESKLRNYLREGGTSCPFCGSSIEGGSVDIDGTVSSQEMSCAGCGEAWLDYYALSGVETTSMESNISVEKRSEGELLAVDKGYWSGECEDSPVEDWKYEVANGDTRSGYWEWCASKLD